MIDKNIIFALDCILEENRPYFSAMQEASEKQIDLDFEGILIRTITPYESDEGDGKIVVFTYSIAGESFYRRDCFGPLSGNVNVWTKVRSLTTS